MTQFGPGRNDPRQDPRRDPGDGVTADRYATWDAAYVLGSLSNADRREYEAHLRTCADCREAVAELSGIPALLATIDAAEMAALDAPNGDGAEPEPPPIVLREVIDEVAVRRRRNRRLTSAAVGLAAALLAVGLVVAIRPETVGLHSGPVPAAAAPQMQMTRVADTPVTADISMTSFGWGTRIDMVCTYGQWKDKSSADTQPVRLGMVVVGRDGSRDEIATWVGLPGAKALPSGNTAMPEDEIASVQLVSVETGGDGKVLLEKNL